MSLESKQIWYSLEVNAVAAAAEAIEHALVEMDALGTEINHLRKGPSDMVTVSGFFALPPDVDEARDQLDLILPVYDLDRSAIDRIESKTVEQTDWLAEWKRHWRPTPIGKFIITPPWEKPNDPDKIIISIEPNMAFGTGTHDTTQLCLRAIGDHYIAGQSVLDVGTGTGILAIAVAKLRKQTAENTEVREKEKTVSLPSSVASLSSVVNILACDTDLDSVEIARENAIQNGVGDAIEFSFGSINEHTPQFDLVIANLTIDVIVPILGLLIAKAKSTLLLSGILVEQRDEITEALKKFQISNFKFEISGEWLSVIVKLNN